MKVTVVLVRVVTKPEYEYGFKRLVDSYLKYDSGWIPDELVVINRYADSPDNMLERYGVKNLRYDGGGWDCGSWLFAARNIETDLLVCFNSSTYITGDGWLKRFVEAVEAHGDGLYGPLASYEIATHIRTPCMIFQPKVLKDYPREVNSREDTYRFEVFGWANGSPTPNITLWADWKGFKTMLVTWDGAYDQPDWRTPPNVFRRGDQSNLIVRDRHCDAYEVSDAEGKARLERLADGIK